MNFTLSTLAVLLVTAGGAIAGPATPSRSLVVVPPSDVAGARVIEAPGQIPVQASTDRIAPAPREAGSDKAQLAFDGCMAYRQEVTLPSCTYGDRSSTESVLLFGDSRAMQYFPAILPLARRHHWKLTGLVRADCVASLVDYERYCDAWKENMLERIEKRVRPDLVVLGSATKSLYRVNRNGATLSREASQPYLVRGMVRLIRRLEATGAKVVVMRDQSTAPFTPSDCVARNIHHLRRCAFVPASRRERAFELTAARRTGIKAIDAQPMFCSRRLCPAVIGDAIVNKDNYHLTATYSRTLARWMSGQLPAFGG